MPAVMKRTGTAAALACLLLGACSGEPPAQNQATTSTNEAKPEKPAELPIPVPEPPLDREQLLLASLRAASDVAAGTDDSARQKDLADRKFEFRIRFGCDAPAAGPITEPLGWSFDEKSRALKIRATPTLSMKDSPIAAIAGTNFEAVEGFWIQRPWLLSAACPTGAQPAPVPQQAEPAQSVGIAQFFTTSDPRTMRRSGRPYEATKKLDSGDQPSGGFDLVLSGRLKSLPDGRVIACTASQSRDRPICVISVELGTVAIERTDTHEQLAQWGTG